MISLSNVVKYLCLTILFLIASPSVAMDESLTHEVVDGARLSYEYVDIVPATCVPEEPQKFTRETLETVPGNPTPSMESPYHGNMIYGKNHCWRSCQSTFTCIVRTSTGSVAEHNLPYEAG